MTTMRAAGAGRNSTAHRSLPVILLAALALRLVFVLIPRGGVPFSDMKDYHDQALSLLAGRGYGPALRPPLYPLFLAAVYFAAGEGYHAARFFQALMGTAVCFFTYRLALQLCGRRGALLAALIVGVYPSLVIYTCLLMSENLFIFLLAASLLLLAEGEKERPSRAFAAGATLGLACLTRSILAGFIPLAALWLLRRGGRRGAALCLLGAALVVAPWSARNCAYYRRFVFIDTYGGYNFLVGNNPDATGRQDRRVLDRLGETAWKTWKGDAHRAAVGYREGFRFIAAHPPRFLRLGARKLGYLYAPEVRELSWGYSLNYFGAAPRLILIPAAAAVVAAFPVLALLALRGVWRGAPGSGGRRGAGTLLALVIAYFSAAHFASFGESRFHLPLVPVLAVLAGLAAREPEAPRRESPRRARRTILCAALLVLLCIDWAVRLGEDWDRLRAVLAPGGNMRELPY